MGIFVVVLLFIIICLLHLFIALFDKVWTPTPRLPVSLTEYQSEIVKLQAYRQQVQNEIQSLYQQRAQVKRELDLYRNNHKILSKYGQQIFGAIVVLIIVMLMYTFGGHH